MLRSLLKRLDIVERVYQESKILDKKFCYFAPYEDIRSNNEIITELVKFGKLKSGKAIFIVPSFKNENGLYGKIFIIP